MGLKKDQNKQTSVDNDQLEFNENIGNEIIHVMGGGFSGVGCSGDWTSSKNDDDNEGLTGRQQDLLEKLLKSGVLIGGGSSYIVEAN